MTLQVSNLTCARGGLNVLERVSFALPIGAALILRGPNGIGKTTLLRTIAGLQPAISGAISLPAESLAYSAHADGLKAVLSVTENLTFWADVHGGGAVQGALQAMNLAGLADRRAGELSAGQKRRLGLARLLVTGRKVWLLDEPTVSLDTASVTLFAGVVRAHLTAGGIAVIASHIDLGLPEADVMDLTPFRAIAPVGPGGFDEAFE